MPVLLGRVAHGHRVDIELDGALVFPCRAGRTRTQPALQRRLAALAVTEQDEARRVGSRLAALDELLEIAPDGGDALFCKRERRPL